TVAQHIEHTVYFLPLIAEKVGNGGVCDVVDREVVQFPFYQFRIDGHGPIMEYGVTAVLAFRETMPSLLCIDGCYQQQEVKQVAILGEAFIDIPYAVVQLRGTQHFEVCCAIRGFHAHKLEETLP